MNTPTMEMSLTREIKLTLLRWLKQGFIDLVELHSLQNTHPLTPEALESELDRLIMLDGSNECQRLKRLGFCKNHFDNGK